MNRKIIIGIIITGLLSIVVSFLSNILSALIQPTTTTQIIIVIVLFLVSVVLAFAATLYYQSKTKNRITLVLQRYSSLWLIVLMLLVANLFFEVLGWEVVAITNTIILLYVSAFGYISTLRERHKSGQYPTIYSQLEPNRLIPNPFKFEDYSENEDEENSGEEG